MTRTLWQTNTGFPITWRSAVSLDESGYYKSAYFSFPLIQLLCELIQLNLLYSRDIIEVFTKILAQGLLVRVERNVGQVAFPATFIAEQTQSAFTSRQHFFVLRTDNEIDPFHCHTSSIAEYAHV